MTGDAMGSMDPGRHRARRGGASSAVADRSENTGDEESQEHRDDDRVTSEDPTGVLGGR
jgi:hypothetical protein